MKTKTGLLAGANDKLFATNLNFKSAAMMVQNIDAIFRSAINKDVEVSGVSVEAYLHEVKKNVANYQEADDICGRASIMAAIKEAMLEKGSLTFITGGSSVGKSKIMESIIKSIGKDKTSSQEARLSVCLLDVFVAMRELASGRVITTSIPGSTALVYPYGTSVGLNFKSYQFVGRDETETVDALSSTNHTVLVLDEADAFIQCAGQDEATIERSKKLLDAVVWNTKQTNRMSVVLVSSDSQLPYNLRDLKVNPYRITRTLMISEPSPCECLDWLQKKIGMGEHLSRALVNVYGGNVYQICLLLKSLPDVYARSESEINVFFGPAADVSRAVDTWVADGGHREDILMVLKELARTGFVPESCATSPLVRLLSKLNLCVFLSRDAVQYQVPKEVRMNRAGLVPASQMLRVLFASELMQIEVSDFIDIAS